MKTLVLVWVLNWLMQQCWKKLVGQSRTKLCACCILIIFESRLKERFSLTFQATNGALTAIFLRGDS